MRFLTYHSLSNGIIQGTYDYRFPPEQSGRVAVSELIHTLSGILRRGFRPVAHGYHETGLISAHKRSSDVLSNRDLIVIVRSGRGMIVFEDGTRLEVGHHWVYVPSGRRFVFEGRSTNEPDFSALYAQLATA